MLFFADKRFLTLAPHGVPKLNGNKREAGGGPVARRVPKSAEPPSLVLLRDHFATSLVILLVLSSALYFTIAIMVRGVLVGPRFHPDLGEDP